MVGSGGQGDSTGPLPGGRPHGGGTEAGGSVQKELSQLLRLLMEQEELGGRCPLTFWDGARLGWGH